MQRYLNLVDESNINVGLRNSMSEAQDLLVSIPREKYNFKYAEGKWTVKELVLHVVDTERIFQYRSLCISRGEKSDLPGFNENDYAQNSNGNNRSFLSLLNELTDVRKSSISLYEGLAEEQMKMIGKANGIDIQPITYAQLSIGHMRHHLTILKERYL